MFEFKEGETGLHKIENPEQILFIVVVAILLLVIISFGIASLAAKV